MMFLKRKLKKLIAGIVPKIGNWGKETIFAATFTQCSKLA